MTCLTALATEAFRDARAGTYGAVVAQDALLRRLLTTGVASSVQLLVPTLVPTPRQDASLPAEVRRLQLLDWPATLRATPQIVVTGGPSTHRFGLVRESLAATFPITTIMHAASWIDLPLHYNMMALTSAEHDAIVVTSRAAERAVRASVAHVEERTGARLRASLVRIPLAVDAVEHVEHGCSGMRAQWNVSSTACVALYVGRFSDAYKADLAPLLNAARAVRRDVPAFHLVLAGAADGPYVDRLRQAVTTSDAAQFTTVLANPSDEMKSAIYGAADIFVSPVDNIQESFGLAVLEAMMHRLPVVASDWSGYRDLVIDGETGFLIPTGISHDALIAASMLGGLDSGYGPSEFLARHTVVDYELLERRLRALAVDEVLRRRFGDAGSLRARSCFSWPMVTEQYRSLFAEQLDVANRSRPLPRPAHVADAFSGYASRVFSSDSGVHRGVVGDELLDTLSDQMSDPVTDASFISGVLRRAESPVPLRDLLALGSHDQRLSVLRLLKHGALVFDDPPPDSGRTAVGNTDVVDAWR
jgi:glycosyltransferase involved in cell wall biosynthesis